MSLVYPFPLFVEDGDRLVVRPMLISARQSQTYAVLSCLGTAVSQPHKRQPPPSLCHAALLTGREGSFLKVTFRSCRAPLRRASCMGTSASASFVVESTKGSRRQRQPVCCAARRPSDGRARGGKRVDKRHTHTHGWMGAGRGYRNRKKTPLVAGRNARAKFPIRTPCV